MFLRVEIVNKGATSFVIFSEAANVPLPFRLENFSQVGANGKNPLRLGGVMLTLSMDFTSQYLNDVVKHFTWLSKCWQFTFKYWLMKSIGRFSFSQLQPHNTTVVGPMCYCLGFGPGVFAQVPVECFQTKVNHACLLNPGQIGEW